MINKLNYGKVNGDSEELHALKGFKVLAVGNGTMTELYNQVTALPTDKEDNRHEN